MRGALVSLARLPGLGSRLDQSNRNSSREPDRSAMLGLNVSPPGPFLRPVVPYVMFTGTPRMPGTLHTVRVPVGNWAEADAIGVTLKAPDAKPSGSGQPEAASCVRVPKRPQHRLVSGWTKPAETTGRRTPKNGFTMPGSVAGFRPSRPAVSIDSHGRRTEPLKSPPLSHVTKPRLGRTPVR